MLANMETLSNVAGLPLVPLLYARRTQEVLRKEPLAASASAQEKSFELPRADVVADVHPDGSVLVTEEITYLFSGSFEGGYREIPLKDGMSVTEVRGVCGEVCCVED